MKTNKENSIIAKGREEWLAKQQAIELAARQKEEAEKRAEEQRKIEQEENLLAWELMQHFRDSFYKRVKTRFEDETSWPHRNIIGYEYEVQLPPEEIVKKVLVRGKHDEIMIMLNRYMEERPYSNDQYDCIVSGAVSIPLYMLNYIAKRSNLEEIKLCCRKDGFGAVGQDYLLETGNHDTLMWYLEHHGFLLEQQKKLIARGNIDEIRMHILHHALAPELLDLLIEDMKAGNSENFYKYIAIRDVPGTHQKALLEVMTHQQFCDYIEHHGFWTGSLDNLIELRTDEEISMYIKRHHNLGYYPYGLAKRPQWLIKQYMQEKPEADWIEVFTSVKDLDYEILTELFLNVPNAVRLSDKEKAVINLLRNGSHEEVMTYLKKNNRMFCIEKQILAELFFRNNAEEFEYYLDNILHKARPRK